MKEDFTFVCIHVCSGVVDPFSHGVFPYYTISKQPIYSKSFHGEGHGIFFIMSKNTFLSFRRMAEKHVSKI